MQNLVMKRLPSLRKVSGKVQYHTDRPFLHRGNSFQTGLFEDNTKHFDLRSFLYFLQIVGFMNKFNICAFIFIKRRLNDNVILPLSRPSPSGSAGQFVTVDPDRTRVLLINCEGERVSVDTELI